MKAIIILYMLLTISSCTKFSYDKSSNITNGNLDLTNYDFYESGNIFLKGLWKFRWMNNRHNDFIEVPSYWDVKKYSNFGYGWYTLRIDHSNDKSLGLYLERAHSSYKMYINNKLLLYNGNPGNTKKETVPGLQPKLVKLPNESPIIIRWKVSNFHHFKGGAYYTPIIGMYNKLEYMHNLSNLIDSVIIGAFFIMFIHYLILYLRKSDEKVHLYFSLLCFFVFVRTLVSEHLLQTIIPINSVLIYQLCNKTDYLCVGLATISLLILFKELDPIVFNKKRNYYILYIWIAYTLFVLVTPMLVFQKYHTLVEILMILSILLVIKIIIKSIYLGNKKYIFTLTGSIILFLSITNDILIFNNIIFSVHLTHVGLFLFILANSIVISDRFTKAFIKAEYLTDNLEKEVKKTTRIIEEQKNELQEIYNNKTSYFVNIAHEIRTPLTLIKNYLDKYISKVGSDESLIIVKNNFDMLIRNITNIFNMQSIELGKIIYNHDNILDVSQHLENKKILLKNLAINKNIILNLEIANESTFIRIDPVAFDNILNNLVENAIKYTPEYGDILITVENLENIRIKIYNSGEGIPEEQLKNIYKPYYQINHNKKNVQGIGLGLSIVKKTVEEINGKISVWSKPGIGTEFTIDFCKIKHEVDEIKPVITQVKDNSNYFVQTNLKPNKFMVERFTIFIIEDNLELLYFLQSIFYNEYNVFCAQGGSDALNQLKYIPRPDLFISDIMMDDINGLTFYKTINKIDKFKNTPFVFLTAKVGQKYKYECLENGAIDFISKPFDKSELSLKVSSILNITQNIQVNSNSIKERKLRLDKLYIEYGVSKRQIEIIDLLKEGLERKEIAYELGISINTVKTQLHRLFEKCGVNNKTELIKIFN